MSRNKNEYFHIYRTRNMFNTIIYYVIYMYLLYQKQSFGQWHGPEQ